MSPPTFLIGESNDSIWRMMEKAFFGTGVLNDRIRARSSRSLLKQLRGLDQLPVVALNLPDKSKVLEEIRSDPVLKAVVVVLIGPDNRDQILEAYQRGANSYVIWPHQKDDWEGIFTQMIAYWTHTALLPQKP